MNPRLFQSPALAGRPATWVRWRIGFALAALAFLVFVAGCMPGGGSSGPEDRAGFFMGIWHGWIAPISVIVGFFNSAIRIYEPHNTGWWYDFGFYMAVIAGFGGLAFFRRATRSTDPDVV